VRPTDALVLVRAQQIGIWPTFQVLRGEDVEVNDFLRYPLFRLAEEMFSRFRARNREEEMQSGLFRIAATCMAPPDGA
jgi:hypothetical protein